MTESLASDSAPSASSDQDGAVSSVVSMVSMDSCPVASPGVEAVGLRTDVQDKDRATGPPQEVGIDAISLK